MEEDRLVKVVISGDSGVGKSSLLLRFSNNHFNPFQEPTIVHFEQKIIEVEGKVIKVLFWDTSGLKSFQSLNYLLYKQAMGIILVYSVGDKETFNNITNLINCINQHSSQDISLLLIGNKIDESNRQVTYEEGERLAKNLGIPFFEISAQDGTNVADIFYAMAKLLKSQLEKEEINFQFELQKNEQNSQLNQFQEEIQIEESEQEQFAIIGDKGVGKTNILSRFYQDPLQNFHIKIIEEDFNCIITEAEDSVIKFQIWELNDQDIINIQTHYLRDNGFILVYSVNDADSFNNISNWWNLIKKQFSQTVCAILIEIRLMNLIDR